MRNVGLRLLALGLLSAGCTAEADREERGDVPDPAVTPARSVIQQAAEVDSLVRGREDALREAAGEPRP